MRKRLLQGVCMALVIAGVFGLIAAAGAERTHRAYLQGYPDGTIRPTEPVTRAQLACVLVRLAETELPEGERVTFADLPQTSWAYPAVRALTGLGLLTFGTDGWFRPDKAVTWRELSGVMSRMTELPSCREAYPALAYAWSCKQESTAAPESSAGSAELSRAELARALNSLLGRRPDAADAQLSAAAWYWDNRDKTAWYYADLIEASVDHTCRYPAAAERWTAIG